MSAPRPGGRRSRLGLLAPVGLLGLLGAGAACGEPIETVVAHVCTPGGPSTCDGATKVVKCTDDGRGWTVTKVCSYDQICAEGVCNKAPASPFGSGKDVASGPDAAEDAGP